MCTYAHWSWGVINWQGKRRRGALCHAGSRRKTHCVKCNRNITNGTPQSQTHPKGLCIFTAGAHVWAYRDSNTKRLHNSLVQDQKRYHPAVWPLCLNTPLQLQASSNMVDDATPDLCSFKWRRLCLERCLCHVGLLHPLSHKPRQRYSTTFLLLF